jgi:hypothetical protein
MHDVLFFDCPKGSEILSSRCQRQTVIWAASYFIGIVLILAVVMPKTDGANLFFAAAEQRQKTATRTTVTLLRFDCVIDILKRRHLFLANDHWSAAPNWRLEIRNRPSRGVAL